MRALWLILSALSVGLFLFACVAEVYQFDDPWNHFGRSKIGIGLLLFGWLGPFNGGHFAWYANPPYFLGLFLFSTGCMDSTARRSRKAALWLAAVALAIGSLALFTRTFPFGSLHGGSMHRVITAYGPGLYAWLGSLLTLAVGCLMFKLTTGSGPTSEPRDADPRLAPSSLGRPQAPNSALQQTGRVEGPTGGVAP